MLVNSFKKTSLQANIFSCYMTRLGGKRKACCVWSQIKQHKPKPLCKFATPHPFESPSLLTLQQKKGRLKCLPFFVGSPKGTRTPVFAVRGRRLDRLTMEANLAAELGFEPRMNESESLVLPLHHSATSSTQHRCRFISCSVELTDDSIAKPRAFVNTFPC